MDRNSGAPLIISGAIVAAGVVAAGILIQSSLAETSRQIGSLRQALEKVAEGGPPAPAPERPAARRGPDPNRRYSVDVDDAPARGPADAKVTLVEFSDFQCPFCRRVTPTLERIEKEYGDDVRVVFKHLPLSIHPKAPAAHAAAEAAHQQGKFWEMHDRIFADQAGMSPERYREYAQQIGLDVEKFERDVKGAAVQKRISKDMEEAQKLGVTGTPAFFVNGRFLSGAQPFESFKRLIDAELQG
jgi:protein-disulfide isomerase